MGCFLFCVAFHEAAASYFASLPFVSQPVAGVGVLSSVMSSSSWVTLFVLRSFFLKKFGLIFISCVFHVTRGVLFRSSGEFSCLNLIWK